MREDNTTPPQAENDWSAADPMWIAARRTLALQFARMRFHEPGTRSGQDPEALHDMRVATRRIRAALRVFAEFIDPERARPIRKGVRRTGRALGEVRDLDVFWEKTRVYLERLSPQDREKTVWLQAHWEHMRCRARENMIAYLDSKRYAQFISRFNQFIDSPGSWSTRTHTSRGEPVPYQIRHVAPAAILGRLDQVLAYDEWVRRPDAGILHRLRISTKRLRYTLEFFHGVLGPPVDHVIEELKRLQDYLGDLQDAVVAVQLIESFLTDDRKTMAPSPGIDRGQTAALQKYRSARGRECEELLASFPSLWEDFTGRPFRLAIMQTLALPP